MFFPAAELKILREPAIQSGVGISEAKAANPQQ